MEDPTLSKTCQICLSDAPAKIKFYHHYGAICCYSCKAFFRRYVRGENNIHLHRCKENNTCPLTEGRKTCKNCRYTKCLQVGMSPEKVLNEEDRKKYTHPKKNKRKSNGDPTEATIEATEESSEALQDRFDSKSLQFLVDQVQKSFVQSMVEGCQDQDNVELLISGHLNQCQWSVGHSKAFMEIMDGYDTLMHCFSEKILGFKSLPRNDQYLLLRNNGTFFREYVMSRYFMAVNGSEQLDWILSVVSTSITKDLMDMDRIQLVDFDTVNQQHGFLISHLDPTAIETYKADLKVMRKYFLYPRFHTALICHYMLFNTR